MGTNQSDQNGKIISKYLATYESENLHNRIKKLLKHVWSNFSK